MLKAARRVRDPQARVQLDLSGVCHKCSFKPCEPTDQMTRYLDKAAKKCMQQEEEYHACPNAECSWGLYRTSTIDPEQQADRKIQELSLPKAMATSSLVRCAMPVTVLPAKCRFTKNKLATSTRSMPNVVVRTSKNLLKPSSRCHALALAQGVA